jgi:hypothetical protein
LPTEKAVITMGKIALLPESLHERVEYLDLLGIPDKYMEDYSVLGIIVDRYQESLALLLDSGFTIDKLAAGSMISLEDRSSLGKILGLLHDNRIRCDYKDIADTYYQA